MKKVRERKTPSVIKNKKGRGGEGGAVGGGRWKTRRIETLRIQLRGT